MLMAAPNYVFSNNVTILARVLFLVFLSEPRSSVIFWVVGIHFVFFPQVKDLIILWLFI